jgi:Flp pilus assembly protein TadD
MKSIVFLLAFFTSAVFAAEPTPTRSDPTWLVEARASIKSEQFEQAIKQLSQANETASADWNNLMGFSLRKKTPPDLIGAENFYLVALKIEPKHKGALEYYGELKLMMNDLSGAEAFLSRLDKICFFGCEEYSDLKEAIRKFKAAK